MSAQATESGRRTIANVRAVAMLLALSFGAAACGSTETSTTPTLATQAPDTVVEEPSAVAPPADESDATASEAAEPEPDATDEAEIAAPAANLFPDIDVLNIADGGTVNLAAELGGTDQATLLWFFAPH